MFYRKYVEIEILLLLIFLCLNKVFCGAILQSNDEIDNNNNNNKNDQTGSASISLSSSASASSSIIESKSDATVTDLKSGIFSGPILTRESAQLETEGIPSKILSIYDNSQQKVQDFFNPLPIVDTINEEEKYGNTGDKFLPFGKLVVNSYEGLSNFVNKLIGTPVEVAKQFSRGITDQLNHIGGKIVGLA